MGFLKAQDTIRTLIISEVRMDWTTSPYVELTNVGTEPVDLSKFEIGKFGPWTTKWSPGANERMMLPNVMLAPGKSFVLAKVNDYTNKMWLKNPQDFAKYGFQPEMAKLADLQVHFPEAPTTQPQSIDSVSEKHAVLNNMWDGWDCIYLRYHYILEATGLKDSVVVDQVGGKFDDGDGSGSGQHSSVAGVADATWSRVLLRKNSVTKGNLDFATARGTNPEESEWMLLRILGGNGATDRAVFWTVGNHGNYQLNSLEPAATSSMVINWGDSTLSVPWGVRKDDSLMYQFKRVPGIGWWYDYSKTPKDSASCSVRTGDLLTVYAGGNSLQKIIFKVNALPPTADDNLAIPLKVRNGSGYSGAFCEVSNNAPGMDTISEIAYATPTDSLTKYLEIAPKATLKYIFVDGLAKRASLKTGDKLIVTSESGIPKTYYIKTRGFWPSHDATLSCITWPDIPAYYKGNFGWKGDTISGFSSTVYTYQVKVPYDVSGIPALVAKTNQLGAKVEVNRALNLIGNISDRTITFTVTAEDDTSKKIYKVELIKEKDPANIQPWANNEPFISEFLWKGRWGHTILEIVNPGPEVLDLSNYMISVGGFTDAAGGVTNVTGSGDYANRYLKYIPGRNWVDSATWVAKPALLSENPDPAVMPFVESGDVFVLGGSSWIGNYPDNCKNKVDIDVVQNPWGEYYKGDDIGGGWNNRGIYLYKILNDSVRDGLKPANDPNDFRLIDAFGDIDGSGWKVIGHPIEQNDCYIRKPGVTHGNPNVNDYTGNKGSFGSNPDNSEWLNRSWDYWDAPGMGGWWDNLYTGIGIHVMDEVVSYKSTVKSLVYKVSEGYTATETVRGVITGTTVDNFLSNIVKADTGQHLKLRSAANGNIYTGSDVLLNGDSLIVVSRDSANTTKYILDITPNGLSNNATLTSVNYTIAITGTTGKISGIAVGTDLKDVVAGVTVPDFAAMNLIDTHGAYVPLVKLNFDTTYVNVKASDKLQFEVIAENGVSKIVYQLETTSLSSDAYLLSDVYSVDPTLLLIRLVPGGTTVDGLFSNLTPAPGATIKLFDKNGLERTLGYISLDDKLQVTAADGQTTKVYYLGMLLPVPVAYVTSTTYVVDQIGLSVKVEAALPISQFIGNLIPAPGATIQIVDELGVVKSGTDNLAETDVVLVTNGLLHATYSVDFTTTSDPNNVDVKLQVYPNPSNGIVHISGLDKNARICVYNLVGNLMFEKTAQQNVETISLNLHKGIYFVQIIAKGKQDVTRKIILK